MSYGEAQVAMQNVDARIRNTLGYGPNAPIVPVSPITERLATIDKYIAQLFNRVGTLEDKFRPVLAIEGPGKDAQAKEQDLSPQLVDRLDQYCAKLERLQYRLENIAERCQL